MRLVLRRLLVPATLLALALPAGADTRIRLKTHSDGLPQMGQPAVDEDSTLWLGPGVLREDKGRQSIIVNTTDSRIYVLNHESSSYHALELPIDLSKLLPPEMVETYHTLTAQWNMEVEVTPTDETREIAGYASKRHVVKVRGDRGLDVELQLWTSEDVAVDVSAFKRLLLEVSGLQPASTEWIRKILAVEGFPVLKVTTVTYGDQSVTSREELVSVDEAAPPENAYRPPANYAEKPFDLLSAMPPER